MKTKREEELPKEKWQKTLGRILKTYSPFKWKLLMTMLFILVSNTLLAITPLFIANVVNQLTEGVEFSKILLTFYALAGCYIGSVVMWQLQWLWEVKYLDLDIPDYLKTKTINHLKSLTIGQHKNQHSMVTINKVSAGESAIKSFCSMFFYNLLPLIMSVVATIVMMTYAYPLAGIIASVVLFVLVLQNIRVAMLFQKPIDKYQEFNKSVVSKSGSELVQNMSSLLVASQEDRHGDKHMTHRNYRARMFRKVYKGLAFGFTSGHIFSSIGRTLILGVTAYLIYIGNYKLGALAAVLAWTNQSIGSLRVLSFIIRSMIDDWASISQYFHIMDLKPAIKKVNNPIKIDTIEGEIIFDKVCFSYPDTGENSLTGVSFRIKPGEKVGIVGPTGAGKSTILSLIQIAYLPNLGSVRVDGIDLSNVDQQSYRDKIGFIEQKPLILSQTLKENLLFGLSDEQRKSTSNEDLVGILKRLGLEKISSRLHQNVGDFGTKLSGGQQQRVVIARMLLKKPDLLVVDEGTSAVDAKTERIIHDELDNLSPGATRIFVAHRISTVQNADKIIVVNKGMIEATGTHEELLEICPTYEELVRNLFMRT